MASLLLSLILIGVKFSSARHDINREPPRFTENGEPQGITVSSTFFRTSGGLKGNLILPCTVTGALPITFTWYMEGLPVDTSLVTGTGTLIINVTENVEASRTGVIYYCLASNMIGPVGFEYTATLRSRNVNVTYTFFDGFENMDTTTETVSTIVGGSVALLCDFRASNPRPEIRWYGGTTLIAEETRRHRILYSENERYLFIRQLTSAQRALGLFYCEARELLLNGTVVRSPTSYDLSGEIANGQFVEYNNLGDRKFEVGTEVTIPIAIAARTSTGSLNSILVGCSADGEDFARIRIEEGHVLIITDIEVPTSDARIVYSCTYFLHVQFMRQGTYTIVQRASVTSPVEGTELIDRERYVSNGTVTYVCEVQGIPAPTVTWFYNGGAVPSGVRVNGSELFIADPQVRHSGVYQCMASNLVDGAWYGDSRMWILEVRMPVTPSIRPLTMTNNMAIADGKFGTVIAAPANALDLVVIVEVESDPCPMVQWRFRGVNISNGSVYEIEQPCTDLDAQSPYTYTLVIFNLTVATSGEYSANFIHQFASTSLSGLVISIPVDVDVMSLEVEVEAPGNPQCLLEGSDVTLTCHIVGFPRPLIIFRRNAIIITPGVGEFDRISITDTHQILITDIEMSDEGHYTCEAITSEAVFELIPAPSTQIFCTLPEIISTMSTPDPILGKELVLDCQVRGTPRPDVTWTKDDVIWSNTGNVFISISNDGVSRLRIDRAASSNTGQYRCTATNDAGSASRSFSITNIREVISATIRVEDCVTLSVPSVTACSNSDTCVCPSCSTNDGGNPSSSNGNSGNPSTRNDNNGSPSTENRDNSGNPSTDRNPSPSSSSRNPGDVSTEVRMPTQEYLLRLNSPSVAALIVIVVVVSIFVFVCGLLSGLLIERRFLGMKFPPPGAKAAVSPAGDPADTIY